MVDSKGRWTTRGDRWWLETNKLKKSKFHMFCKLCKIGSWTFFVDCHTSITSNFVGTFVGHYWKKTILLKGNKWPSQQIRCKQCPNYLLATMEGRSLFTKMPNSEAIATVKRVYQNYPQRTVSIKQINTLLVFVLTLS